MFLVFLLTGLWHGADFSFVFWGLYHGFFSIIERLGLKKILEKSKFISWLYCFIIVNFGWVLFRADNTMIALRYIKRMVIPWKYNSTDIIFSSIITNKMLFICVCAILGMGVMKVFIPEKIISVWQDSVTEAIYCVILLILCLASIASNTYNPFIYFQF